MSIALADLGRLILQILIILEILIQTTENRLSFQAPYGMIQ